MKKIATLVGAGALLAATIIPAIAVNSCGNSTTGPGSNNTCSVLNSSVVTVNNVNDAQIFNRVTSTSNTGGNSASNNTLGGSITTGNATLNGTVGSVANVNTTNVTGGFGGGNNNGYNEVTGPFSNNSALLTNTHVVGVQNDNTATVNNVVTSLADTGNNRADNNTGPASVRTGNSLLAVGVGNHVNDNWTEVNLFGGSGTNTAGNSTTGPFSSNAAAVINTAVATINNVNDLIVNNLVGVTARSGANSASNNTLGGDIQTGSATAGLVVDTEGNLNVSKVAAAMGGFSNSATSNVTGPDSNNSAFVDNTQVLVADNWNNKCRSFDANRLNCNELGVFNYVTADSDAGNNNADNNTGPGGVMAGWASLIQSVLTHLNDNLNLFEL